MAKKDELLLSFLQHELIAEKYKVDKDALPRSLRDALNSDVPIIKAIALIIEGLESTPPSTDNTLRNQITQFLNEAAI
jgi:hypothetical protein